MCLTKYLSTTAAGMACVSKIVCCVFAVLDYVGLLDFLLLVMLLDCLPLHLCLLVVYFSLVGW